VAVVVIAVVIVAGPAAAAVAVVTAAVIAAGAAATVVVATAARPVCPTSSRTNPPYDQENTRREQFRRVFRAWRGRGGPACRDNRILTLSGYLAESWQGNGHVRKENRREGGGPAGHHRPAKRI
jgi:hypothetical protein